MKKYLFLLVLTVSSAVCFAQQHQTALNTQKEINEENALINEVLDNLCGVIQDMTELKAYYDGRMSDGNCFFKWEISSLDTYINYLNLYIDEYYPLQEIDGVYIRKYIGTSSLDSLTEYYIFHKDIYEQFVGELKTIDDLYISHFIPFAEAYASRQSYLDSLKMREINYCEYVTGIYYGAIEYVRSFDDEAYNVVSDLMYNCLISDVREEIELYTSDMDGSRPLKYLDVCADSADVAFRIIYDAKAMIEKDCPDVKDTYLALITENEQYFITRINSMYLADSASGNEDLKSWYMYDIKTMINHVNDIVEQAKAAQSGCTGLESVEIVDNGAKYYNLNGVKVRNPKAGTIVIKTDTTGKTQKVIIR